MCACIHTQEMDDEQLTSPDKSCGQGYDEGENTGHHLAGGRDDDRLRGRVGVEGGHETILGRQFVPVPVQQVQDDPVAPAEAQLDLVLATAPVPARDGRVVLRKTMERNRVARIALSV